MTVLLVCGFCLLLTQVGGQRVELGMSSDSFDDAYVGCEEEMESQAPDILKKERQTNLDLNAAWAAAARTWPTKKVSMTSLPVGFIDEYGIALLVYTNMTSPVYKRLNQAIREYGADPQSFPFHALHFYLTRALVLLHGGCGGGPRQTYRGTSRITFEPPPNPSDPIRLSQFSSSSTDIKQAQQFGNASFFNITTCFGADIQDFSSFPEQREVLIPVDEVFQVVRYVEEGHQLVLRSSSRRCSFYNCAYLGGSKWESCVYSSAPPTLQYSRTAMAPLLAGCSIVLTSLLNGLIS